MEGCKTCNYFITTAHKTNMLKNFKMICIDGQKDKFKAQGLKKVPTIIIPSINKQFEGSDCIKWLEDMIKISSRNNNFGMKDEELYIPDIGVVSNNSNISNSYQNPSNKQLSQLTDKITQLSSQINSSPNLPKPPNQFDIPKTNIIKRTGLNPIQPPNFSNGQSHIQNQIKNINSLPITNPNSNPNLNQNNNSSNQNNQPIVKPVNQLFGYLQNEMTGFSDGYAYVNVDNPLPKSFLPPDKDMEIYTAPEGEKIDKKKQEQMTQLVELERKNEKEFIKKSIDDINRRIAMGEHNLMPNWVGAKKDL